MNKLSSRILISLILALAVVLGPMGWYSVHKESRELYNIMRSQGEAVSKSLASFIVEPMVSLDYPALEFALEAIGNATPQIQYVEVRRKGQVVARYGMRGGKGEVFLVPVMLPGIQGESGRRLGDLELVYSSEHVEQIIANRVSELIVFMLSIFVILSVLVRYVVSRLVTPRLTELNELTGRIIDEELKDQVCQTCHGSSKGDELDALRERFMTMLAGLRARDKARDETEKLLRQLSVAVEQSPVGIVMTNVKAEIEYVNSAFIESTGYSRTMCEEKIPACCNPGRRRQKFSKIYGQPCRLDMCGRGNSPTGVRMVRFMSSFA